MSRQIFRRLWLVLPLTVLPSCTEIDHRSAPDLSERAMPFPAVSESAANDDAMAVARDAASAAVHAGNGRNRPTISAAAMTESSNTLTATYVVQIPPAPAASPQAAESTTQPSVPAPIEVEDSVTLMEIEEIAQFNNPTLAQAEASITGAQGRYVQGGLYPNPQVGYQAAEVGNDGRAGQQGAYVSQTFVTACKLQLNQHAAAHEIEAKQHDLEAQRLRVLTSVRTAFYDVLNAQRTVTVSEQLLKTSEEGVKTAQALFDAQQAARVDLLQAKIELNGARVLLRNAQNRHSAAWLQLATLIGQPDRPLELVGGKLEPMQEELGMDAVMTGIMAASPELRAANAEVQRARAAMRRAEVEPIPDIQTQAGVQYDYSTQFTVVGLQAGVNLPIFNRNEGNILVAYAEMTAAQREVDRLQLDLKNRLATVMEDYQNATYQVERFSSEILPDSKESLKLITSGYLQGEFDYNRLLLAQRTYFQNNIAYLAALREWWTAKLQIDGLLLSGGLSRSN